MVGLLLLVKKKYPETECVLSNFSCGGSYRCNSAARTYYYELSIDKDGRATFATIDCETKEKTTGANRLSRDFYGLEELEEGIKLAEALDKAFEIIEKAHTNEHLFVGH